MKPMKICILSSEIMPYAKTGGLADVAGALIGELKARGHDVRGFMPLYRGVRDREPSMRALAELTDVGLRLGDTSYLYSVLAGNFPGTGATMYFIDCPALYDRPGFYTSDADEHRRFILFTRAALETCRRIGFGPDVFHCNDWHTGFLPLYLKTIYSGEALFERSRSLMTIHNIGYQGVMSAAALDDLGVDGIRPLIDPEDLSAGVVNALRTGLKYADVVSTVSPTYAREICATELGMGMQATLLARGEPVIGILNGVDYREWDPRHDPHLGAHFDPRDLAGKRENKRTLLGDAGLTVDPSRPLIGMVSRLAEQKGFDLLMQVLPRCLAEHDCAFVALGSGEPRYAEFLESLVRRFPGRAAFSGRHDEAMAHLIEAGSDAFLMPSRYEPCGLNQMYSLRYGTIPIVRNTGGLADSVRHFDPGTGEGTGCVFNDYDTAAVNWAIGTTLSWYADAPLWDRLVQNAMAQDFSWSRQVAEYEALYRRESDLAAVSSSA